MTLLVLSLILETSPHTRGELSHPSRSNLARGNIPAYAGRTASGGNNVDRCRKHPRIRGENADRAATCAVFEETSPHTRGELTVRIFSQVRKGNIPAYAGRTMFCNGPICCSRKHPRIRGENLVTLLVLSLILETSPHTRGERLATVKARRRGGNIPAYAGRTFLLVWLLRLFRKHPRIRGENHLRRHRTRKAQETSPHTRGER